MKNYDSDNDVTSIHSIVTENEMDFQSGNEAPEDGFYQEDKIIKNYVIKRILRPGVGVAKPSKHDYLECKL